MTVLAHAGHWLVQLLYLAPLAVIVVALLVGRRREQRQRRAAAAAEREQDRGRAPD
jgi:cytochrome c-type biogenesis protein CcmH/NrfF